MDEMTEKQEEATRIIEAIGTTKGVLDTERSCINCKSYYFAAPQHDQPYPEFACLKGHWDGISCENHYDELFKETNCDDFAPLR